jgi:hypothetical protein
MENATKALEIAGSVLLGVLILGLLVFEYRKISNLKKVEEDVKVSQQSEDFNKKFEAYNRNLYGSELLSLANQIQDYNDRYAGEKTSQYENQGYQKVEVKTTIKTATNKLAAKTYNLSGFLKVYNDLARDIENMNKNCKYKNKSISYWANSGKETERIFPDKSNKIYDDIAKYKDLYNEQLDITRKTFKCTKINYDNKNGRITNMTFEEI